MAWIFMQRIKIPDYVTRFKIIQTPWFGVWIHKFDHGDSRATLHDHPASFVSLVLRGGYIEIRPTGPRIIRHINIMRIKDCHYISNLLRTPTWTLLLIGRQKKRWGYLIPTTSGYKWIPPEDFKKG
jgi:hypothetical protein